MTWQDVRKQYPHRWVLIEALKAHSEADKRILESLSVVDTFQDVSAAMLEYKQFHRNDPEREYYVIHTDKENLDIEERQWLGIRAFS